jgi:hypothetical protein
MARIQQDQFIDEDEEEEVCPLCVEEFDLADRYFKPCPCGYQVSSSPLELHHGHFTFSCHTMLSR